eukprot:s215_g1.t1
MTGTAGSMATPLLKLDLFQLLAAVFSALWIGYLRWKRGGLRCRGTMPSGFDYSKWDNIELSDDEEDARTPSANAEPAAAKSEEESYMTFLEPGEDWVPLHSQSRLPQWDAVDALCRAQLHTILRYQRQLPPGPGVRRQLHVLEGRLGGWSLQVRVIREVTALAVD